MDMLCSDAALQAFYFKERRNMTNAQCWKRFHNSRELFQESLRAELEPEIPPEEHRYGAMIAGADGMVCAFDEGFPALNPLAPEGERPFLLFYKGSISLLEDLNKNVAVIGLVNPDDSIMEREKSIVRRLVAKHITIVSGLAKGCDAVAHRTCLEAGGRTIAILPTQLERLYPAENRRLAEEIVENGGLLLTEYAREAKSRYEAVKRFTDRDRLQAMFSKAVIMIASCRRGEGDSGSRYAMESAKKYGIKRYVLFDSEKDGGKAQFGLNQDLLKDSGVKALCRNSIEDLATFADMKLSPKMVEQQIALDMDETYF